jgi:hypothetical protein
MYETTNVSTRTFFMYVYVLYPSSLVDLFADAISIQLMGGTSIVVDIIYDIRSYISLR